MFCHRYWEQLAFSGPLLCSSRERTALAGPDVEPMMNLYAVRDTSLQSWYFTYKCMRGASIRLAQLAGKQYFVLLETA